jgi:hypothetical protein
MSGKEATPKDHRFVVEDLLDLYTSAPNPNGSGMKRESTRRQKAGNEQPTGGSASPEQNKQSAANGSG